jgi:hypothetical protein
MTQAKAALLDRCRSEVEQTLHKLVARWPVDVITNEELHDLLGDERPKGSAFRHAIERAGIVRLREWKGAQASFGTRTRVTAYALRNAPVWKVGSLDAVRAEIARVDKAEKEERYYSDLA